MEKIAEAAARCGCGQNLMRLRGGGKIINQTSGGGLYAFRTP